MSCLETGTFPWAQKDRIENSPECVVLDSASTTSVLILFTTASSGEDPDSRCSCLILGFRSSSWILWLRSSLLLPGLLLPALLLGVLLGGSSIRISDGPSILGDVGGGVHSILPGVEEEDGAAATAFLLLMGADILGLRVLTTPRGMEPLPPPPPLPLPSPSSLSVLLASLWSPVENPRE